jgi:hypothetical protein
MGLDGVRLNALRVRYEPNGHRLGCGTRDAADDVWSIPVVLAVVGRVDGPVCVGGGGLTP